MHVFCSISDNLCNLKTLGKARGEEALKWHTFRSLSKIGIRFSFNDQGTFAECLRDQIHVILADVLQGTGAWFGQLGTKNNTRPYRQITTEWLGVCNLLQIHKHTEKGKFLFVSQEVLDNTFLYLPFAFHDYSGFIVFSGEY